MVSSLNFLKSFSLTVTSGRLFASAVAAMIESASLIYLPGSFLSSRKDFCHLTGSGIFFLRVPSFAIFSKWVSASFEFLATRFTFWVFGLSVMTFILSLCARRRITSLSAGFDTLRVIVSIDRVWFQFQFCQDVFGLQCRS